MVNVLLQVTAVYDINLYEVPSLYMLFTMILI